MARLKGIRLIYFLLLLSPLSSSASPLLHTGLLSFLLIRLGGSIHFQRPDLFQELRDVQIPLNPPFGYFQCMCHLSPTPSCYLHYSYFFSLLFSSSAAGEIPGVGELMVASFPEDEVFNKSLVGNTWYETKNKKKIKKKGKIKHTAIRRKAKKKLRRAVKR